MCQLRSRDEKAVDRSDLVPGDRDGDAAAAELGGAGRNPVVRHGVTTPEIGPEVAELCGSEARHHLHVLDADVAPVVVLRKRVETDVGERADRGPVRDVGDGARETDGLVRRFRLDDELCRHQTRRTVRVLDHDVADPAFVRVDHEVREDSGRAVTAADRPPKLQRRRFLGIELCAAQSAHLSPSCGTAAASSSSPSEAARSIAALLLVTPNFR